MAANLCRDRYGTIHDGENLVFPEHFPQGYHKLEIGRTTMDLIIVPPRCWLPAEMEQGGKVWGIAAQLYLLRSAHNWGIGDFSDLRELIKIAANWGADVVGLNPLHAMFIDTPEHASPYSPASRPFLNIFNIDITAIAQFSSCAEAQNKINNRDFNATLERARSARLVEYEPVAELKLDVLRSVFNCFQSTATEQRRAKFNQFVHEQNGSLERYCLFQAIRIEQAKATPTTADWTMARGLARGPFE